MVNVWDYVNAKKMKITDIDGREFVGNLIAVMDTEESGEAEDDITIQVDDVTIIDFLQSEIEKIEVVEV